MKHLAEIRLRQAERLYELAYRRGERAPPFGEFLSYVPPLTPGIGDARIFSKPVLVDRSLSHSRLCCKLNVGRKSPHARFVSRMDAQYPLVSWIWCHDGRHRVNVTPANCLKLFGPEEFGLGAEEGVFFHAQYPLLARERFIDLPGSMLYGISSWVACIGPWAKRNRVWLHHVHEDERHVRCGSGSYCLSKDANTG